MYSDDELFDVLNDSGERTETTKRRGDIHRDGDWHASVHIWIARRRISGMEFLLQKRADDKDSFPDCYDISSAGHVPAGSSVLDSAIRELSEELGIKASPDDLVPIGTHEGNSHSIFYGKPFHNHEFSTLYLYTKPVQIKDLVLQKSEIQSVKWFNLNQLMEDIKNNAPGYCLYYDELQILKNALDNR